MGRAAELGWLEGELRGASAGELRCVLLVGEPGVGKTRLAEELLGRNRDCQTGLRARAQVSRKTMPFSLWVEALEPHLRYMPRPRLEALCGGFLDDLSSLFRSLAVLRGPAPAAEAQGLRLLEGLAVLVDNIAREQPLTLLLDDLPMADSTSLDMLDYMARGLPQTRALVIATARPAALDDNLVATELVTQLEQDGRLRRFRVQPLDRRSLRELARDVVAPRDPPVALVDWLEARSRGNPLFAIGLLSALLEEEGDLDEPRLRHLPEDLSQRVRIRYRRLQPEARELIEILAVLGARVDFEDLRRLEMASDEVLAAGLDQLVRSDLALEEANGPQAVYELAHPLVQEAIYTQLGVMRRTNLHRGIARALARQDQPAAAAPHFALSGEVGDSEAIDALMLALRRPQHVYREAMVVLRSLADLLPAGDPRWLDILDFLYQHGPLVLVMKDELDLQTVPRILSEIERTLAGSTDLRRLGAVQYCLSTYLATDQGDLPGAEAACREALRLFESAGEAASSRAAACSLAWIRAAAGDLRGQIPVARTVARAAEKAGDWPTAVFGLILVAFNSGVVGRFGAAERAVERAIAIVRQHSTAGFLSEILALQGSVLAFAGRLPAALEVLDEALAATPAPAFTLTLALRTEVTWLAGAFASAVRNGMAGARSSVGRMARNRAYALASAAVAAAELGSLDEARDIVQKVAATYGGKPFWLATWQGEWAEGFLLARSDRVQEAIPKLEEAAARMLELGALSPAAFVLADLAEIAARRGLAGTAAEAAARLQSVNVALRTPLYRAVAGLAGGWAALAAGNREAAASEAGLAADILSGSGYESLHARSLEVLGLALASTDRARAAGVLQQAADIFSRCQASWRRQRVEDELSRLGHRRGRGVAAGAGPEALSPRERQVAGLAAQAYTAREIAEMLSIGVRTVETHLENAYAKLGISSKAELVRRAGALGVFRDPQPV